MDRPGSVPCSYASGAPSRRSQSGQSLVEVFIAMALLAGVFLVLAGGLFTVIKATDTNKRVQNIDTSLVTYGEILQTQIDYVACPGSPSSVADFYYFASDPLITGSNTPSDKWRKPNNIIVEVLSVSSWNQATQSWSAGCLAPDSGVQKVKYQVTGCSSATVSPCDAPTVRTGEIVKRKSGPS